MKIILANPRGFCAGVWMAVESLDLALIQFGTPVYVFHEIVHNRRVIESFEAKGAVFVDDLECVPEGSILMFSAHGVTPAVRRQARSRQLQTIDATCPLVAKVHHEAIRFARAGFTIILVGHAGHDEVVGTIGEAPSAFRVVGSVADVDRLELPQNSKVAWLTQTTLSVDETQRIVTRLQQRFPGIVGPPREDICYATQNRQQAVKALCGEADAVVVVGSQTSSNSQRLKELASQNAVRSWLVDGSDELRLEWFHADDTVLVTAGASAPEVAVEEVVDWLVDGFDADVEVRTLIDEDRTFPLPKEIRRRDAAVSAAESLLS